MIVNNNTNDKQTSGICGVFIKGGGRITLNLIENVSVIRSFSYKTKILNFSIFCNKIILLSQFTLDRLPLLLRKNQSFSSPKTSQQSARKPYCPLLLFNSPWFAVYCRVVLKKTNCIFDKQPDTWQKNISLKNNLFIQ